MIVLCFVYRPKYTDPPTRKYKKTLRLSFVLTLCCDAASVSLHLNPTREKHGRVFMSTFQTGNKMVVKEYYSDRMTPDQNVHVCIHTYIYVYILEESFFTCEKNNLCTNSGRTNSSRLPFCGSCVH